ncbi:apses-domain-containing protein [Viridothelium virens]|uniref:Apses-domain-containing protein n=1 Tax=Viridothelium virens TaxID=1048519 RepID=A0A6A6HKN9_VIRVR|nr:apses-domain-containing protein [Viridothelium virens]
MPADGQGRIYSATYSNVPVYEYSVGGNHVMRRRSDDWINATHILKVADFDKPQRTRILEREVQKGVHEKVQGGYGKYQGTWIPLHDGRSLAEKNNVLDQLRPIFDFVPGDRSPPPAPKHATAASAKPRAPRQSAQSRKVHAPSQVSEDVYDAHLNGDTPDNETIASESMMGEDEMGQYTGSRKRKRGADFPDVMSLQDQQHQLWADELLDYFMLHESDNSFRAPPEPPMNIDVNRHIDEKGHTALHWAAAMGDIGVVKDLIQRGARTMQAAHNGDTPLMRAVMFTNNYDRQSMDKLFRLLQDTVGQTDWYGSTVFHHIAATTQSKSKFRCARYYLETIVNRLFDTCAPHEIERLLNMQDNGGDTAMHLCARHGAGKCLRSLLGRNAAVDIQNHSGRTGDDEIQLLNGRRQNRRQLSSSPFQNYTDGIGGPSTLNGNTNDIIVANGISTLSSFPTTNALMNSLPSPQTQHRCEAALTLSQQLPHLLLSKTEKLAQQLDAEVTERDVELADSERLARQRQEEVDALRLQIKGLEDIVGTTTTTTHSSSGGGGIANGNDVAITLDPNLPDEEDERQAHELDELLREAESVVEHEQLLELDRLLEPHGKHAARDAGPGGGGDPLLHQQQPIDPMALQDAGALQEKLHLAKLLAGAQQERQMLVREVVQGLAAAGMGERQMEYKRLITGALGVREEDVEGMLPEILKELEEVAVERG